MDTSIEFPFLDGDGESQDVARKRRESWPQPDPAVEDGLIQAAVAGCEDSFRQLVGWHQEAVYHFCYQWLQNPEDAREACQDTFVRVYAALGRYRRRGRFSTWLYRIALNRCRDLQKSKAARQKRATSSLGDRGGDLACQRPAPDEAVAQAGDLEKLRRGVALLPDRLRAALILSALEGLSHEECAAVLKCSVRAVEGRIYRARRELMTWWDAEGE